MTRTSLVRRVAPGPLDHVVDAAAEALDGCDFSAAAGTCLAALPWVDACGDRSTGRYLRYVAAMALRQLGEVGRATAVAEELLDGLPAGEDLLWRAKALALSAELALAGGRPGRAVARLSEAEDLLDGAPEGRLNHLSGTMATALALQAAGAHPRGGGAAAQGAGGGPAHGGRVRAARAARAGAPRGRAGGPGGPHR